VEKVRRRSSFPKLRVALGSAVVLLVILVVALSVKRYRAPEAAPPEALAHIAEKNRHAAIVAAAHQRTESAASTNAVDNLAEARRNQADAKRAEAAGLRD
jgi:hypothetical protein